jgi:hypothetical protein
MRVFLWNCENRVASTQMSFKSEFITAHRYQLQERRRENFMIQTTTAQVANYLLLLNGVMILYAGLSQCSLSKLQAISTFLAMKIA